MAIRRYRGARGPITLTNTYIKIMFEGKHIKFKNPVCRDVNRIYLPLAEFLRQINGAVWLLGRKIVISLPKRAVVYLDMVSNYNALTFYDNELYISLIDLCILIDLKTVWVYEKQSISLYYRRENNIVRTPDNYQRPALIRFEDITAGNQYLESSSLEYLRVIGDFLYFSKIPFHIAWIPRFIDPTKEIDNDISRDYSMANAHFLFTIEYLLYRGGIIGLHGYTHQDGDEMSGDGTEFSEDRNNDETDIRKRIEEAIELSNKLSLAYKFFESPHYASTAYQQSIYENYFDIIYEGYVGIWGEKVVLSPRNQRTIYVPTPLGYVEGENGLEKMIERINTISDESLASLFYHPYAEFDFITVANAKNGYPTYDYKTNSPLHQMIDAIFEKNCRFIKVTDLL
jgi:hypothetical protein